MMWIGWVATAAATPRLASADPPAALAEVAHRSLEEMDRCGPATGALQASITVRDGRVIAVNYRDDSLGDEELRACLLGALFTWTFSTDTNDTFEVPLVWFAPAPTPVSTFTDTDTAAIGRVVRRNAQQIRYCYEQALRDNPHLSGSLSVDVQVEAGAVREVSLTGTMESEALQGCIVRRVHSWQFPAHISGQMTLPFNLNAG